jgi:hypothetical protein
MTLNNDVHKNILVQILIDIYSDTSISPYLGFRGEQPPTYFMNLSVFPLI